MSCGYTKPDPYISRVNLQLTSFRSAYKAMNPSAVIAELACKRTNRPLYFSGEILETTLYQI